MLKRDTIIMVTAVVCGILAFVLVANFLNKSAAAKQAFVVAGRNIPAGQIISEEDLTMSAPMQSKVSNDLFTQVQDALGNQAVGPISIGSLVYRSKVNRAYTQTGAGPESLPIPPGMRAMTIAAREIDGMPERLGVGTYLDILGMALNYEGVKELLQFDARLRGAINGGSVVERDDGEIGGGINILQHGVQFIQIQHRLNVVRRDAVAFVPHQ